MHLRTFLILILLSCGSFETLASLKDEKPVGLITFLQQRDKNPVQIYSNGDHRRLACARCPIYEGDLIHTRKGQAIIVTFSDESEISVADNSRLVIERWHKKIEEVYNRRSFFLIRGILHVKVKKAYSFEEPFLVRTSTALVAVRGTEFVIAINEIEINKYKHTQGVTLYTLEGEVHFTRDEEDLKDGHFALVPGGYYSTLQSGYFKPTTPTQFNINHLRHEVSPSIAGGAALIVQGNYYYAKAEKLNLLISPQGASGGDSVQRAIASIPPAAASAHAKRRLDLRAETANDLVNLSKEAASLRAHQRALDQVPEPEEPPAPGELKRQEVALDRALRFHRRENHVLQAVVDPGGYPRVLDRQPAGMSGVRPDLSRQFGNFRALLQGGK